jgi:hypothetical protein
VWIELKYAQSSLSEHTSTSLGEILDALSSIILMDRTMELGGSRVSGRGVRRGT